MERLILGRVIIQVITLQIRNLIRYMHLGGWSYTLLVPVDDDQPSRCTCICLRELKLAPDIEDYPDPIVCEGKIPPLLGFIGVYVSGFDVLHGH